MQSQVIPWSSQRMHRDIQQCGEQETVGADKHALCEDRQANDTEESKRVVVSAGGRIIHTDIHHCRPTAAFSRSCTYTYESNGQ
jgi:hypothetical protein